MADGWKIDGAKLRALREETEIKVIPFADLIGCHHNHYRKFERGTGQPSPELLNRILRVLGQHLGRKFHPHAIADRIPTRRKVAA